MFFWQKCFRMRYLMFSEVGTMSFYVFVGAAPGPDPRRAPPGPDPRRAPPGPRGGPRAPAGPDPRRAPLGPRAPQGPIPAGPHQGPGEGPGDSPGEGPGFSQGPIPAGPHQGPGPRRARSPQDPTRAQGRAQGRAHRPKCDFFIIINAFIIYVYDMYL